LTLLLTLGILILKKINMQEKREIQEINFENDYLLLKFDGRLFKIALEKISKKLQEATITQRNFFKISPSGYGIHWPLIDEDISITALLNEES